MILLFKTVLNPAKIVMKPTETSKKNQILEKKKCKTFKFLEKIAKISSLKKIAKYSKILQKNCKFSE